MAVDWKTKPTRGHEYNWLIASILERGQDAPVVVRKDGDMPVLTSGFSRYRAVVHINKHKLTPEKLRLRSVYRQDNEVEGFKGNIAENRFRNQTTPLDDAYNKRYNMTEEEVAEFYFPSAQTKQEQAANLKWVRDRSALAQLTPEAEIALKEGRLKLPAAKAIAKLSEDQQREAVKGNAKVKASNIREASGKPKPVSLKDRVKSVIDQGWFPGPNGKQIEASIELLDWLGRLVG